MDPITIAAIGGVTGGAASKFVDRAWDCGEKWLSAYFQDHRPKAVQAAQANSMEFLKSLARRLDRLEQQSDENAAKINCSLDEPQFAVLLQKALIGSAKAGCAAKREALADLVAQRLLSEHESLFAVTSEIACDAITHCTFNQLGLLAFHTSLTAITPDWLNNAELDAASWWQAGAEWFEVRFNHFCDVKVKRYDVLHLEALSCLSFTSFVRYELTEILEKAWANPHKTLLKDDIMTLDVGKLITRIWEEEELNCTRLTTVGQLIGVLAADNICEDEPTSFASWQEA